MDNKFMQAVMAEAMSPQVGLYWLSFVDTKVAATIPLDEQVPGGPSFLGVVIVEAFGPMDAVMQSHALGVNPGGEVKIYGPAPNGTWGQEFMNRLLSFDEVQQMPSERRD